MKIFISLKHLKVCYLQRLLSRVIYKHMLVLKYVSWWPLVVVNALVFTDQTYGEFYQNLSAPRICICTFLRKDLVCILFSTLLSIKHYYLQNSNT